jgi:SnoaL-like domain
MGRDPEPEVLKQRNLNFDICDREPESISVSSKEAGVSTPRSSQELFDIEAIKQLKADYFFLMDTKQWDRWEELFTTDLRVPGPARIQQGRDAFTGYVRKHLEGVVSCHFGFMPVIDVVDSDNARGRWSMFDDLRLPTGHPWCEQHSRRLGYGFYEEEYRRDDGSWRISFLELSRIHVWFVPDPMPWPEPG